MPFSDPIRDRRVQPQSLAFNDGKTARGGASATYQSTIKAEVLAADLDPAAAGREMRRVVQDSHGLAVFGEQRAMHYAANFGLCYEWDMPNGFGLTTDSYTKLRADNEVIRCQGAIGKAAAWEHLVGRDQEGRWHVHCFVIMNVPSLAAVEDAYLALEVNGALMRFVDMGDADMAGDGAGAAEDIKLQGECIVTLRHGDLVQWSVFAATTAGTPTLYNLTGSEFYCFIEGHRISCDIDEINPRTSGVSYAFTP